MTKLPRRQVANVAQRSLTKLPPRRVAKQLAAYLLAERRTHELESLLRDIQQYRADHGIVEVKAIYAHPLTEAIRRGIKADIRQLYPGAKQIIITQELDETVLGGIRLELANEQFDASLRSKLNRFKQLTTEEG